MRRPQLGTSVVLNPVVLSELKKLEADQTVFSILMVTLMPIYNFLGMSDSNPRAVVARGRATNLATYPSPSIHDAVHFRARRAKHWVPMIKPNFLRVAVVFIRRLYMRSGVRPHQYRPRDGKYKGCIVQEQTFGDTLILGPGSHLHVWHPFSMWA